MTPIIIISGPTAVGKTAVINLVLKKMPQLQTAITYTTRATRPGQKEDKKMIHVSETEFKNKIRQGALIEWSHHYGNYYGTAKKSLITPNSKPLLLNIGFKGPKIVKKNYPQTCLIFIKPESMKQIKQRLLARKLTSSDFRRRYNEVVAVMKEAHTYDYQVINHEGKIGQTVNNVCRHIRHYLKTLPTSAGIDKKPKSRYHHVA